MKNQVQIGNKATIPFSWYLAMVRFPHTQSGRTSPYNPTEPDLDEMATEEDDGRVIDYTIKPSHDPLDREAVNSRLRAPEHKLRSHTAPNESPTEQNNVIYGSHITYIDGNRLKEHEVPVPQRKKLEQLLRTLKTPTHLPGRQGKLMELKEDLDRYETSVLPLRSSHNNLMATLDTAVTGNLQMEITILHPYQDKGKMATGYNIKPIS